MSIKDEVLDLYRNSSNTLQNLFFQEIEEDRVSIYETEGTSFARGREIFLNKKYIGTDKKIVLNHEMIHVFQDQDRFDSFRQAISIEQKLITYLLFENHAIVLQNMALTYDELTKSQQSERSAYFYKALNYAIDKKKLTDPKEIFIYVFQRCFIDAFNYAKNHQEKYVEHSLKEIASNTFKALNIKDAENITSNIKSMLFMLIDSVPLILGAFPFPPEIEEKIDKSKQISVEEICSDIFIQNCVSELTDADVVLNSNKVSVSEAINFLKNEKQLKKDDYERL